MDQNEIHVTDFSVEPPTLQSIFELDRNTLNKWKCSTRRQRRLEGYDIHSYYAFILLNSWKE